MRPNALKVAGIALCVIALAVLLATAAGCQSSQEAATGTNTVEGQIQVIYGQEPRETPNLVFVDIDDLSIRAWQRSRLDGIVTDYARNIGADTVFVRITDETNRDILYTVTAYKHR